MRLLKKILVSAIIALLPLSAFSKGAVEKKDGPLRILAIGNSFTEDAVEWHLWGLFNAAGIDVVIGNEYRGGCTVERHWGYITGKEEEAHAYRKVVNGKRTVKKGVPICEALKDEEWDVVCFQQGQAKYGVLESHYPYLDSLITYVRSYLAPGTYKLCYQLNWSFPEGSPRFEKVPLYENDQMKMYRCCVEAAKGVKKRSKLDFLIPTGTAVQNARTTRFGDTMNRDWGHLDKLKGRYTASCVWFETITGINCIGNSYIPEGMSPEDALLCQKAAHAAVRKPYKVTKIR